MRCDIMGETAVEVFGYDRAQLRQAADRIGPRIEDITGNIEKLAVGLS